MIPRETVEIITDAARIEDVVGDYLTLKRRGASFVACCPFHHEKTPSFYVTPAKGIFKCFGCGKSGTAVGFVMEMEHCSYADALRVLARKYHIEIVEEQESAEELARRQRSESLMLVSDFAARFFARQLSSGEGRSVGYAYYKSRGITDETIEKFGLGWAPGGRSTLIDAARADGYKDEYLLDAGLAVRKDDGTLADKFRERVMFPIHSVSGRVIAFSGRTLRSDNPAKYVNTPTTEIYSKERSLLGIYFAKGDIAREDRCILVEGNVDVVMMHQLGIRNVVASCGTSLTVEQVRLIHKFTSNITIMYDGDGAGIHAAVRGLGLVLAEGMNVRIVMLPDGEDPDSFARKHNLAEVREYISSGEKDFIDFKAGMLLEEASGDPLRKAELINDIADTIALIPDPVKRSTYSDFVARRFGVESGIIYARVGRTYAKRLEDERKTRERRKADADASVPETHKGEIGPAVQDGGLSFENTTLEPAERDLIKFLLMHGCDEMEFSSDSPFYPGSEAEKPTVADFISVALEKDGTIMANSAYAAVYEAYIGLYDEGLTQTEIVRKLVSSQDMRVSMVSIELSTEKYELTVKRLSDARTATASLLAANVPRAIQFYGERRLQDMIDKLRHSLAEASEEEIPGIMSRIVKLQSDQMSIKQKIGREKQL